MLWQAKPQLAPRQAKIAERKAATVGLRKQYLSVYAGNSLAILPFLKNVRYK
jgi:hypothetical protein